MVNLILGLGGTGAKVVESFVHLCAAGLGPPRVSVAFVDQDQSNGNTLRARQSLARYAAAHEALREAGGEHPTPACNLLRTRLEPHPEASDPDSCHWVPQRESDADLAGLISYNLMREANSRGLAHALFHYEHELRMDLREGYRGRPHVGSAALLMRLDGDAFWQSLDEAVRHAGEEIRVFLCGSAFGGTGAAVLPTLARRLRQVAEDVQRPLRTGGVLMLPYFTFRPPEDSTANVAAGHELLLQSQSALRYYDEMEFGKEPYSFDDLYFVGWHPAIELEYHSHGAASQANPPLAPELFAALAAAQFFREERDPVEGGGGGSPPALHVVARNSPQRLAWGDLPPVREESAAIAYATWLRFCALWRFNYSRAFSIDPPPPVGARDEAWYRTILGGFEPDGTLRKIGDYVSTALRYAAAMSAFSTWHGTDEAPFELWTHRPIATVDLRNPPAEPDLDGGGLAGGLQDFATLIQGYEKMPDAADVYWAISQQPAPAAPGLWPFVALLHKCAAP